MTNQPSASARLQDLLNTETRLLLTKLHLSDQLASLDQQIAAARAAIQGVQLGQEVAREAAEAASVTPAEAP